MNVNAVVRSRTFDFFFKFSKFHKKSLTTILPTAQIQCFLQNIIITKLTDNTQYSLQQMKTNKWWANDLEAYLQGFKSTPRAVQ